MPSSAAESSPAFWSPRAWFASPPGTFDPIDRNQYPVFVVNEDWTSGFGGLQRLVLQ